MVGTKGGYTTEADIMEGRGAELLIESICGNHYGDLQCQTSTKDAIFVLKIPNVI